MFVTTSEPSISRGTVHEENNKLASPEAVYGINITFVLLEKNKWILWCYHLVLNVQCGTNLEEYVSLKGNP